MDVDLGTKILKPAVTQAVVNLIDSQLRLLSS